MLTAQAIRQAAMARRSAQGLKLVLRTPEGEQTLYPKDHATLERWRAAAERRGYAVVEGGGA